MQAAFLITCSPSGWPEGVPASGSLSLAWGQTGACHRWCLSCRLCMEVVLERLRARPRPPRGRERGRRVEPEPGPEPGARQGLELEVEPELALALELELALARPQG